METSHDSIGKAFDWLVLLVTVLSGVILAFWMWLAPVSVVSLDFTARLMSSLIVPLLIMVFPVFVQHVTFNAKRKMIAYMFSWGAVIFLFAYYVLLFLSLELVILTRDANISFIVSLISSMFVLVLLQFPFKNIINFYKSAEKDNPYWKMGKTKIWIPYVLGILAIGIVVLLSIVPFTI